MPGAEPSLTEHGDGITAIDTDLLRPQFDACHLVTAAGRAAFVDSGVNASVPLLLAASCRTGMDDMNLLQLESLRFKAENEEIRAEDLKARYEKRKRRADRLADQLLELQHRKEEDFAAYDRLRGELARVERDRVAAEEERAAAAAALEQAKAERLRLSAALAAERGEIEKLEAELAKLEAKRRALEAANSPAE